MKHSYKQTVRIWLFISVGIFIFFWVYKDLDLRQILNALLYADYRWILLSLILGVFSHLSRAVRWVLLIEPLGHKAKISNSFFSVLIMYLTNMAIPRSGEFVRCTVMARYENVPFSKLLGTVITERVFDFIMLFMLLAIVLVYQINDIETLIENNPGVHQRIVSLFNTTVLFLAGGLMLGLLVLFVVFRKQIKNTRLWKKVIGFVKNLIEGVRTVWLMEKKLLFIVHTLLIWLLYYLMLYVVFFAFDFTSHLTVMQGLTIFIAAGFGMVFPSPGGIGSWHFMVMQTLFIYGVKDMEQSGAFAFAAHGSMTLLFVLLGIVSFVLMPLLNAKKSK